MWGQTFENIYDLVIPYPDEPRIDLTASLVDKNYTTEQLFKVLKVFTKFWRFILKTFSKKEAENFFISIGLDPMTPTFWKESMFEKPKDKEVVCHASATDLSNGFDFRRVFLIIILKLKFSQNNVEF